MLFTSDNSASRNDPDPLALARTHSILVIDSDEDRAQKLACLLTLASLRAIVVASTYQAFERYLQERLEPALILLGQQAEMSNPLFARFYQRLVQDLHRELPVLPLANLQLENGHLLEADTSVSTTAHRPSAKNIEVLEKIWHAIPAARFSLESAKHSIALERLPHVNVFPHVAQKKRSRSIHLYDQLKAARKVIPAQQWDTLMTDVGLARFRNEENWPPRTNQYIVPPEDLACLNRAILLSDPPHPRQQAKKWAAMVDSDVYGRSALIFVMQQVPRIIGRDRAMRTLLNVFSNEVDTMRGEKLTAWKRYDDGSFDFVFYSSLFVYGVMGSSQPTCDVWQASFDVTLQLSKQERFWNIYEVECSSHTHTGHCVFHIEPK